MTEYKIFEKKRKIKQFIMGLSFFLFLLAVGTIHS